MLPPHIESIIDSFIDRLKLPTPDCKELVMCFIPLGWNAREQKLWADYLSDCHARSIKPKFNNHYEYIVDLAENENGYFVQQIADVVEETLQRVCASKSMWVELKQEEAPAPKVLQLTSKRSKTGAILVTRIARGAGRIVDLLENCFEKVIEQFTKISTNFFGVIFLIFLVLVISAAFGLIPVQNVVNFVTEAIKAMAGK